MALFLKREGNDYCLGVWKVEESLDTLLSLLPASPVYKEQFSRITSPGRKIEWLAVRALLCTLTHEGMCIHYHSSGRPCLNDPAWQISISHTRGYVAILLSRDLRPGIDIEQYGTRVSKIAGRFMHADEVASKYQESDTWSLLLHWSAKEVMFKCLDTDRVDFKEHLRIFPFEVLQAGQFDATETRTRDQFRFTVYYSVFPDFVLTWSFLKQS